MKAATPEKKPRLSWRTEVMHRLHYQGQQVATVFRDGRGDSWTNDYDLHFTGYPTLADAKADAMAYARKKIILLAEMADREVER